MAARKSSRIYQRDMKDCFSTLNGQSVDVSNLHPVEAFGKLSAMAMLVTQRVGDPNEDASMSQARPRLSQINDRGLVTFDSQMGVKRVIPGCDTIDGSDATHWQRSYIKGVIPGGMGEVFKQQIDLVDGIAMNMVEPVSEGKETFSMYEVPVTRYDDEMSTFVPMLQDESLLEAKLNFLPEVQSILNNKNCEKMFEEEALLVVIVDMVWGRQFWLFDKVSEILGTLQAI